jgi:hypothetical protein
MADAQERERFGVGPKEQQRLARQRELRAAALDAMRKGIERDQAVLDQFADAKQIPPLA